jgi:type I restriction enzyme, S subunit
VSDARVVQLDQLYDFASGLSKPRSEFGDGFPFLSFKDVFYNTFVPRNLSELVRSSEAERRSLSIMRGDVFLTRTSETVDELGMSCVALTDVPNATFNGFTKRLRPKAQGLVVPEYAGYFFRSPGFRSDVYALSTLSTRASLNNEMLAKLAIKLPPVNEQQAIGQLLKTLDDKIELNQRMNETLETMARAQFKSWFVDFDPVRAKMEGRDLDLPRSVAGLFPDGFDDSERGPIPRRWSMGLVGDVAEHPRRGIQPGEIDEATPYIALDDMPRRCISLWEWGAAEGLESGKLEFKRREILFGKLRPYFHKVGIAPVDGVCSTDIVVVVPRSEAWFGFVLGHVSSDAFVEHTNAGSTGTKMPRTNWRVAHAFTVQISSKVERLLGSIHENRTLATLRDTLLPKLISGELRVKAAEKIVEAVA